MRDTIEISPCPFCGEHEVSISNVMLSTWITCSGCGATTASAWSIQGAIKKWNRRAPHITGDGTP